MRRLERRGGSYLFYTRRRFSLSKWTVAVDVLDNARALWHQLAR